MKYSTPVSQSAKFILGKLTAKATEIKNASTNPCFDVYDASRAISDNLTNEQLEDFIKKMGINFSLYVMKWAKNYSVNVEPQDLTNKIEVARLFVYYAILGNLENIEYKNAFNK